MEQLNRQVRKAQRWLGLQRFVGMLGWCCLATLILAVIAIAVDKFRPTGAVAWAWSTDALEWELLAALVSAMVFVAAALAMGMLAATVWAAFTGRGPIDAAIEIDRRFRLKERVSSALAMSEEEHRTPLGQALVDDAERRVRRIDVGEHFTVSPGRQMLLPFIPGVIAVSVALLVSPASNNQAQANTEAVKRQIETSAKSLRKKLEEKRDLAKKQGLKDAQELFKRLEEGTDNLADQSQGQRKKAMVKLNDLARQIKERRKELGGADQIRKQLNELKKNIERGPADKFLKAVKQGNFKQAMKELENLKKELAEGKLNDKQREQLAKQLDQMQEKLKKLADAHRQAQEDLQNRIDQARKAGRQDEADKLQEQLDALQQQLPQMDQLQNMADKLGQCAQCLRGGQLQDAGNMLQGLQADVASLQEQLQELDMLDEAMAQLGECRGQMNCPQCGGLGCGACQGKIPGMGLGKGRGMGDRPEEENDVGFIPTKPPMKIGPGTASVVGEAEGPNYKGDVQLEMREQYQTARRQSADPVTVQHLPRGYQQHVLEYSDQLREGD